MPRSSAARFAVCVLALAACAAPAGAEWILHRSESFDDAASLADGQRLGQHGWLLARLRGSGTIELDGGSALVTTPQFSDSALLRLSERMPAAYRLRVRVGEVRYGYAEYEPDDYLDPAFKYNRLSGSSQWVENGFYWLTLTDRAIAPDSGEDWWHRYRKVVVDSDDHLDSDGATHTERPLYMVYMNPALDRSVGDWTSGHPELLRTWSNGVWHDATWNWEVAFHYADTAWYVVELEKSDGVLHLRTFTDAGAPIELAAPVPLEAIYAMDGELEFAYVGEPHVDSYEGSARIDAIELWLDAATDTDGDGVADPADSCPVDADASQADLDADGRGDACDLDDGVIRVVATTDEAIAWQLETGYDGWNVYRGDLATLRAGGAYTPVPGTHPAAARWCGASGPLDDGFVPAPGAAAFYLVTGTNGASESGLGPGGGQASRPNTFPCSTG